MMRRFGLFLFAVSFAGEVSAQSAAVTSTTDQPRVDSVHQVDPGQMYHRVYAIVPMVGSGTPGDPKRPMFVPLPVRGKAPVAAVHTGVIGFQMWPSDDGNFALVEFVGATPPDLKPVLSAAGANVTVFERGKHTQAEIEAAFQRYRKGFTLGWSTVRAQ